MMPRHHAIAPLAAIWVCLLLPLPMMLGCGNEPQSAKRSLFEDDHEVAAHWPDSLADAAGKLRERLDSLASAPSETEKLRQEIVDLVSWTPEIAADTNLSEQDWLPVYHAAESLSANLRAAGSELGSSNREQLASFCDLVEQSLLKIPDHLASLESTSP